MQSWRDFKRIIKAMWPMSLIVGAVHMLAGVPFWMSMVVGLIEVGMWAAAFAFFMNAVDSFYAGRAADALEGLNKKVEEPTLDAEDIVRTAFAAAAA